MNRPTLIRLSLIVFAACVAVSCDSSHTTPPPDSSTEPSPSTQVRPPTADKTPEQTTGRYFGLFKFENGPTRQIEFIPVDGLAVLEGDIVLGDAATLDNAFRAAKSASDKDKSAIVINGTRFRWPSFTIPYSIETGVPAGQTAEIQAAIATWNSLLSARGLNRDAWIARTTQPDYVTFHTEIRADCNSLIGRRGGQQLIRLGANCRRGEIEHEMGHAMGLWHEQSRVDRDKYIRINFSNIQRGQESNFEQHIWDGGIIWDVNQNLWPYDYDSIMHYGAYDYAIDRNIPTIEAPQAIGQRNAPSYLDVEGVWANQSKSGWGVRICDGTRAATIKFRIGYIENNTRRDRYWFQWTAGERQEFETPADVRYKRKLWISAEGDPHDQINMCIVWNNEPAQGMTFSADENKEVDQSERTDECRCR